MKDLDELLNFHASDKQSQNGYAPLYHALFKRFRHRDVTLLEIGIGTVTPNVPVSMYGHDLPGYRPGASLRAWRDYFPYGRIYGVDIQPDTMITDEPRIVTALADSTIAADVTWPRFDIIIDDASHICTHQLATLRTWYGHVKPNGFYIIEDVNRVDPNQPRLPVDHKKTLEQLIGNDLYFVVSFPKADVVVISRRGDDD